mmetsp:Transcript_123868/g.361714  ORF Transcript_123868/g.361714 Transcript_123868/m.361714 type:complete len:91 (+) Transcript_123868:1086-1358(+)
MLSPMPGCRWLSRITDRTSSPALSMPAVGEDGSSDGRDCNEERHRLHATGALGRCEEHALMDATGRRRAVASCADARKEGERHTRRKALC